MVRKRTARTSPLRKRPRAKHRVLRSVRTTKRHRGEKAGLRGVRGLRSPVLLAPDIVLKLPCAVFKCTKLEVEYREVATRTLVTSVMGPQGQAITQAAKPALYNEILDAIFAGTGPGDTPETRFPTTFLHDCPSGCTCPEATIVMGAPEDTTQDVEIPIERRMPNGKIKNYTVTVRIKVRRKVGSANCT